MRIRDLLKSIPGNNVRKIKDYVTEPKPNGYSSLHLYVEIEIFLPTGPKYVPVEIQIRDKAMDMWVPLEATPKCMKNTDKSRSKLF
jgi:putative GTP pyrophosphokinase